MTCHDFRYIDFRVGVPCHDFEYLGPVSAYLDRCVGALPLPCHDFEHLDLCLGVPCHDFEKFDRRVGVVSCHDFGHLTIVLVCPMARLSGCAIRILRPERVDAFPHFVRGNKALGPAVV